jgi:Ca2+-binding EF-hand superfamily protein
MVEQDSSTLLKKQQEKDSGVMDLGSTLLKHALPESKSDDECERCLYESLLTPKHFQELRDEFFADDKDHDGYVDKDELRQVINKWYSQVFTPIEIDLLMKKYDQKKIDFYEFVGLYCAERIEEKLVQLQDEFANMDAETANAKFVFSIFDAEDENKIHKRELKCMLRLMRKKTNDEYVDQLFSKFAQTEPDSILFNEFLDLNAYLSKE